MPQNSTENSDDLLIVVTSLPNLEAATALARALVEANLAACVQMSEGLYSVYRWEGKVYEEQEVLLSAKTIPDKWLEISGFIKNAHSYDLPEILAFSPEQYEKHYGKWVDVSNFIKSHHTYDLPEVIAYAPEKYEALYGKWVQAEVK